MDPKERPHNIASDVVLQVGPRSRGGGGAVARCQRQPFPPPSPCAQLSSDGGHRFHSAELEYPMMQHSYTILDTSNDAVFLHVNHGGKECVVGRGPPL